MLLLVSGKKKNPVLRTVINYLVLSHTLTWASLVVLFKSFRNVHRKFLLTIVVHLGRIWFLSENLFGNLWISTFSLIEFLWFLESIFCA